MLLQLVTSELTVMVVVMVVCTSDIIRSVSFILVKDPQHQAVHRHANQFHQIIGYLTNTDFFLI